MKVLIFLVWITAPTFSIAQTVNDCLCTHPFPNSSPVSAESKAPTYDPIVADKTVTHFYDEWKRDFLRPGSGSDNLIIRNDEPGSQKDNITTSEAISYGLVIVVMMAGYDSNAKTQFDQLYRYARSRPSKKNKFLMAWAQDKDFTNVGDDSAVDGDIDIAFSLLLAYKQWKDEKYKEAADSTLAAILNQEIDATHLKVIRGNASVPSDGFGYQVIRMSDFMPAEFRSFYVITGKDIWLELLEANYKRYEKAQDAFSKTYGLFPDYIEVGDDGSLSLVPNNLSKKVLKSEGIDDGGNGRRDNRQGHLDGFNSCRVPWRIATDYLLNGDSDSKQILGKINAGIRAYCNDSACYLANTMAPDESFWPTEHLNHVIDEAKKHSADLSTIGPLCVAALLDDNHLEWRNRLLGLLVEDPHATCSNNDKPEKPDYYASTIRMICLLFLSKNYWAPEN